MSTYTEYMQEYAARPEQRAKRAKYQKANPDKFKEYSRVYREKYPERILIRAAKQRAKDRGLEFDIDQSDIIIPDYCPILGIPIKIYSGKTTKGGGHMDSPSIDRIDNSLGYVKGNVQVISHKANSMKFTATKEELLKFADWIYKTYD